MPTLPATATSRPACRKIAPSSSAVVVLPFVPVTPTNLAPGSSVIAELDLRPHRDPPLTRGGDERRLSRYAGRLDQDVDAVEQREVVLVPERPVDDDRVVEPLDRGAARARETVDERSQLCARKGR